MVGWEPPLAGRGVKSPVLRCAASHRLRLARLTLKVLTTSARAMPRSSAASTRSRKSTEYAFIEHQHTTSSAVVLTAIKGLWTHMEGGFYHDGRYPTLRA